MRRSAGFTLVEVMVVMVIIGVLVSTVSLAMGSLQQRERDMALQQIRRSLEAGVERAMVRGVTLAVELYPGGYRFVQRDIDDRWLPLVDPPFFADRSLPSGWSWQRLVTTEGEQRLDAVAQLVLAIEPQPFQVELGADDVVHRLSADGTGTVSLEPPERAD